MNKPIRVMLCDDSSVMRRLIRTALASDPEMNVVYEAQHGKDAVENVDRARPDIVLMDVEMPVMDGIDAVRAIRRMTRTLPIIMFSSLTSQGAEATLDALAAGASDFSIKPTASENIKAAMAYVQRELISKIRDLTHRTKPTVRQKPAAARVTPVAKPAETQKVAPVSKPCSSSASVVAIGVSTGGPEALSKVVSGIPKGFSAPILITQHMPPVFTALLSERLSAQSGHVVREACEGDEVVPGQILIAPGDFHLRVKRERTKVRIHLNQDAPQNSCRPAVDPMFVSVAECYGSHALGVILTGMGVDGSDGAKAIHEHGGRIFVQDKETSVVWGMPGNVVNLGLADRVMPLPQIPTELVRAVEAQREPVAV